MDLEVGIYKNLPPHEKRERENFTMFAILKT